MLMETRIENDRLCQNMVPPLKPPETDKLLHEQLPYAWMSSIVALFKEVSGSSPNAAWAQDKFALTVQRIHHEELRCRQQGRLSVVGGPMMGTPPVGTHGNMPPGAIVTHMRAAQVFGYRPS